MKGASGPRRAQHRRRHRRQGAFMPQMRHRVIADGQHRAARGIAGLFQQPVGGGVALPADPALRRAGTPVAKAVGAVLLAPLGRALAVGSGQKRARRRIIGHRRHQDFGRADPGPGPCQTEGKAGLDPHKRKRMAPAPVRREAEQMVDGRAGPLLPAAGIDADIIDGPVSRQPHRQHRGFAGDDLPVVPHGKPQPADVLPGPEKRQGEDHEQRHRHQQQHVVLNPHGNGKDAEDGQRHHQPVPCRQHEDAADRHFEFRRPPPHQATGQ